MLATESDVERAVRAIVEEVQPLKIILFGSSVREYTSAASDVDFLVIQEGPFDAPEQRLIGINRILAALRFMRTPADVLLYSADEVSRWADTRNHIIARALHDGRTLYERA